MLHRARPTCATRPIASPLRAPSMPSRVPSPCLRSRRPDQNKAPRAPSRSPALFSAPIMSLPRVPSRSVSLDRGEPMKAGRPRVYVDSVGRVLDHYVPPYKLSGWLSPKKIFAYLRSWTTWFWTRRRLIAQLGRMDWYAFKRQMGPRYVSFHEALASGDQHTLRSLMTEPGFTALKNAVSLDRAKKMKFVWKIESLQAPKIVSYGLLGGQIPGAGWTEYAQILVLMKSKQSFAVYDKSGALVSGDEAFKPVKEYMLFEAHVKKGAPWKITTKIALDGKPVYELVQSDDNPSSQNT